MLLCSHVYYHGRAPIKWLHEVVIVAGVIAVLHAFMGWRNQCLRNGRLARPGRLYTIALHAQLFLGLLRYLFASPIV